MATNRLYNSSSNQMLFGVCGGLADYFYIDPVLMRVAFVVLALANGIGVLLYITLAIDMPKGQRTAGYQSQESEDQTGEARPSGEAEEIQRAIDSNMARHRSSSWRACCS